MLGRALLASTGLGWLALELPAACVSGRLLNEAPAGRGPVTAWLERGEQHPLSGVPVVTHPRVHEEDSMKVMIGIDPHKSTHTAVAIDSDERPVGRLVLTADRARTGRLVAWAALLGDD